MSNEEGERVGILLDLAAYNRLANPLAMAEDLTVAIFEFDLTALAVAILSSL